MIFPFQMKSGDTTSWCAWGDANGNVSHKPDVFYLKPLDKMVWSGQTIFRQEVKHADCQYFRSKGTVIRVD